MALALKAEHFRNGSIADHSAALNDVRFTPDSGRSLARRLLPLCANDGSRHHQEPANANRSLSESSEPQPIQKALHISGG